MSKTLPVFRLLPNFERAPGTSTLPPTPDIMQHRANGRMWSATSTDFFNTIGQEPTWRLQFFAGGFATSRMRLIKSCAIGLGGANTFCGSPLRPNRRHHTASRQATNGVVNWKRIHVRQCVRDAPTNSSQDAGGVDNSLSKYTNNPAT